VGGCVFSVGLESPVARGMWVVQEQKGTTGSKKPNVGGSRENTKKRRTGRCVEVGRWRVDGASWLAHSI
jgi:hypothetical protein